MAAAAAGATQVREVELVTPLGTHPLQIAAATFDEFCAHLERDSNRKGIDRVEVYDPCWQVWHTVTDLVSVPAKCRVRLPVAMEESTPAPKGKRKISECRTSEHQQHKPGKAKGMLESHLSSLSQLLMPVVKELILRAFSLLDANGDGTLGSDDFVLRAQIGGGAEHESSLWSKLCSYFQTFLHGDHIDKEDFSVGLLFMSMRFPLYFALPPPGSSFATLVRHLCVEVNWRVCDVVAGVLEEARAPLTADEKTALQYTIDQYRLRTQQDVAAQVPFLRALSRWCNGHSLQSLKLVYSSLDADGNGKLEKEDFATCPHVWDQVQYVFSRHLREYITFDELMEGFLSLTLASPGPAAIEPRPGTPLCIVDLCRECKHHLNQEIDVQANKLLVVAGKMSTEDARLVRNVTSSIPMATLAHIEKAWAILDTNGDDVLTPEDFKEFKGDMWSKMNRYFDSIPGSKPDGAVEFDEFVRGFVFLALQDQSRTSLSNMTLHESIRLSQGQLSAFIVEQVNLLVQEAIALK